MVECLPGFDGGLDQLFHMEVTDLQTGQRIANTSQGGRAAPEFEVSGLNSGRCGYLQRRNFFGSKLILSPISTNFSQLCTVEARFKLAQILPRFKVRINSLQGHEDHHIRRQRGRKERERRARGIHP